MPTMKELYDRAKQDPNAIVMDVGETHPFTPVLLPSGLTDWYSCSFGGSCFGGSCFGGSARLRHHA